MFRKDFFTLPTSESFTDTAAGINGMHLVGSWGANRDTLTNFPEAEWAFYDNPSGPYGKGRFTENPFAKGVFCCPKNFQHADKWIEVANWRVDKNLDPWRRMHGWQGQDYDFDDQGKLTRPGISFFMHCFGPWGTRGGGTPDPYANADVLRYQLDEWGKIPPEQRDAMQEATFVDPISVLGSRPRLFLIETTAEQGLRDEFQGMPTPTAIERGADLTKLEDEMLVSVITGEKPLDAFDEYVTNWKQLGGDKWTEEVSEWYRNR